MKPKFRAATLCFALIASAASGVTCLRAQSGTLITGADSGGAPTVNVYQPPGTLAGAFIGAGPAFTGGVRVGTGDVNGDGAYDIICGEGAGGSSVRVFSGPSRTIIAAETPFGTSYNLGVYVAGGDINHDGRADIVAGAGNGGTPQVKVLSGANTSVTLANFFAFDPSFTGGVRVASGDVNGDGFADIIAGSGIGAGAIRVFNGKDLSLITSISAFGTGFAGGLFVGAADVNHDGFADIIAGSGSGSNQVRVFSGKDSSLLRSFSPFDAAFTGEVRVAGADLNGDGFADVIAGQGAGGSTLVKAFDGQSLNALAAFQPYGPSSNGAFVAGVPEPSAWALLAAGAGLAGVASLRRRRDQ